MQSREETEQEKDLALRLVSQSLRFRSFLFSTVLASSIWVHFTTLVFATMLTSHDICVQSY